MVKHRGDNICGVLLLDKPTGMSSNHALQRVKRLFNAKKAGHTGSLDPLATGLLPVCFGKATCLSDYFLHSDKKYQAEIQFGVVTDSHDSDGDVVQTRPVEFSLEEFQAAIDTFLGEIEQIPPMVSALKHKGEPLYKLALRGEEIERKARKMTVHSLKGQLIDSDKAILDVHCSSGFYVRQLAADLGEKLGCGAHITQLRRTASKRINIYQTIKLDDLFEMFGENAEEKQLSNDSIDPEKRREMINSLLLPPDELLYFLNKVSVDHKSAIELCQGKRIVKERVLTEQSLEGQHHAVYLDGDFLGIGEYDAVKGFKVRRLFNSLLDTDT